MVSAIKGSSGRVFQAGPDLLPADPGTGPDWAYGELGVRATMTVELEGPSGDSHGFCAPSEWILSIGKEQFEGVKALARYLLEHGGEPSRISGTFSKPSNLSMESCDEPGASADVDNEPSPQSSADISAKARDKAKEDDQGPGWVTGVGWVAVVLVICTFLICMTRQVKHHYATTNDEDVEFAETRSLAETREVRATSVGRV
eukprot:TRINITY_DN64177_c0_g1_i3.p1 TRINITY_DN64177_c0_g1~~TRINITY_DN64177_c0_g1_i3.p1  ORF type:complete len:202 (+),score=35.84 TRINITY_DN64177_c0_g1_i3:113-718(+)